MSWLTPLIDEITGMSNPQSIAEKVIEFLTPISHDIEPGTEDKWWNNQINAAIKLSAVKPHFYKAKENHNDRR